MFLFYTYFYGYFVGMKITKTIGKKWIYRTWHNKQLRYRWYKPNNPRTQKQQRQRDLLRQAIIAWKQLTEKIKNTYRKLEPITPTMSGYNFYLRQYIRLWK